MVCELHSLATHPTSFKGTVISPTKICLQFNEVQAKLRVNDMGEGLGEMPDGIKALPIRTDGKRLPIDPYMNTDREPNLASINVGCQMPTVEAVQFGLINAYISYAKNHSKTYREEYGHEFLDYLLNVQHMLSAAILTIRSMEYEET